MRKPNLFRFTKKFPTTGYGKKYRLREAKTFGGSPTWLLLCPDGRILDYKILNQSNLPDEVKQWVWSII